MKRTFELNFEDMMNISKKDLLLSISSSEGRTVMAETDVAKQPIVYGVSNPELAAAFGADMITLNLFDFDAPFIFGIDDKDLAISDASDMVNKSAEIQKILHRNSADRDYIRKIKNVVGRLLGVNMEPIPKNINYCEGRKLNKKNLEKASELGFDYIVITGNPKTGITNEDILNGIKEAADILGDKAIIIAGKMHGAGSDNIYDPKVLQDFSKAGADIILIGAPGTIPGLDFELCRRQISAIHETGKMALTAIGTSQEGANLNVIQDMALMSKMAGADIQHIGDAGYGGIALPENIAALSIAIRGKRHTYRRMAYSLRK
ncbi:conserved protein of unknown function [Tepidanaerobacter acetatoxydans Re1]|uniref:DUF7916 domain-containing protein n=1 Tax=Tepidanaerobacter acetatoxydans (strain DSM 21804 / JCM 16047 / Re1) TaxID=1209989 RepID=F4LXR6_TEPAE|nr:hypothetical protein [Tepidanaerobacter acetatoxydans]AEE91995.1 hypothetical protein TepRe1_1866 [Tepidanaerobacter acetatoxydans Re1]CCP26834.1 conserved protein of unknown function [Tepidanaerobacter acetatoxydans Re1]